MSQMSDERPVNRRSFFRHGLGELLKPMLSAIDPMTRMARELGKLESGNPGLRNTSDPGVGSQNPASQPLPWNTPWIRPPGALPDASFVATCTRGGECVEACPAQCIKIDPTRTTALGAPFISIDTMPCVLCAELKCMQVCPSGALVPTPLDQIDMGTALWRESSCLRHDGQDCRICIDDCPIGEMAIILQDGKVRVIADGCTGCGICQNHCPTTPKSITVIPVRHGLPVARGR